MGYLSPLLIFPIAFVLWVALTIYAKKLSQKLEPLIGESYSYWTVISAFYIFIAVVITLLYPPLYFIQWNISINGFLFFLSLSMIVLIFGIKEILRLVNPKSNSDKEKSDFYRKFSPYQESLDQLISSALPEELIYRYTFLGLLSLWNPLAGIISVAIFFGIGHKISHPERCFGMLISNVLSGFVFGLGYLFTKSILMIITIHWLDNMIVWIVIKYERLRVPLLLTIITIAIIPFLIYQNYVFSVWNYLVSIYSLYALIWGILIGILLVGVIYIGYLALQSKNTSHNKF